jgi:hypothetical protein
VRVLAAIASVLCAVVLGGCVTDGGPRYPEPAVVPGYAEAAARFNARVARLDRVWSRVNLTLRSPKERGGTSVERAEGYLQLEQPDRTSLSIMKLGETYFSLGSDAEGYWWLDMSERDRKTALYGLHAEATPELVGRLGLPVHPRELLDLFGITPLPVRAEGEPAEPGVADWDGKRGMLRVETGAMWGRRVVWFDPVTMAPQRVELRAGARRWPPAAQARFAVQGRDAPDRCAGDARALRGGEQAHQSAGVRLRGPGRVVRY